jgi:predicted nuclease of restriction endonuclease-like (RecB) superfamily
MKNQNLYSKIADLIEMARRQVITAVNTTMVYTYFEIGRMVVEDEQQGQHRATYGKQVLKELSIKLSQEFGKGFSSDNLERMKKFYILYSNSISATPLRKFTLSWSHYLKLMRISNENERNFYEIEAFNNHWSLRELDRQFDSALYERLALSRDKNAVKQLSDKGQIIENPSDIIKDPYILEFVGLPEKAIYSESKLESQLISELETFLLELGKGFTRFGVPICGSASAIYFRRRTF